MLSLYEYRTEKKVVSRIMNLALMKFSLLPCGVKYTPIFFFFAMFNTRKAVHDINIYVIYA